MSKLNNSSTNMSRPQRAHALMSPALHNGRCWDIRDTGAVFWRQDAGQCCHNVHYAPALYHFLHFLRPRDTAPVKVSSFPFWGNFVGIFTIFWFSRPTQRADHTEPSTRGPALTCQRKLLLPRLQLSSCIHPHQENRSKEHVVVELGLWEKQLSVIFKTII